MIPDDFTAIEGKEESDDRFMEAFIDTLLFAAMTGFIVVILIVLRDMQRRKKNEAEVARKKRMAPEKKPMAPEIWQKDEVKKQEDFSQTARTRTDKGGDSSSSGNERLKDHTGTNKTAVGGVVQSTEKKDEATPIPPQKAPSKPFILYLKPANAEGIFREGESTLNYRYHIAKLTLSSENAKQGSFEFLPSAQEKLVAQWTSYLAEIATIRPESNFYQPAGKLVDVVPGVLEKEGGHWKVKKKAEVTIK